MSEYLKIPEVARRLDVSEKTVRRYIKSGALPSTFIGGAYRVSEENLEEYIHRSEVKPEAPKAESRSSLEPSLFNGLEAERRADELKLWRAYLTHLAEHFEELAQMDAPPAHRRGWGDVAPGVAGDALTVVSVLVEAAPKGTEVKAVLRAAYRLSKVADRIEQLAGPPGEEDMMKGIRQRQDRMLTEIRFRRLVEGLELSDEDREEIFA